MSEPASFVIIRDGERRTYSDRWAHVFVYRNLIWGPEELEQWLRQEPEDDQWNDDIHSGVVVDFDQRRLVWDGDDDALEVPRVANVLDQLLATSWPDYKIRYATRGLQDLAIAAGEIEIAEALSMDDSELLAAHPKTIRDAVGQYDEDDDYEEGGEPFIDEDGLRAWITLIDEQGAVRHRHLSRISQDLFTAKKASFGRLLELDAAEVPPEKVVREGMWFDLGKRKIGVWGGRKLPALLPILQRKWKGFEVTWANGGYADQCTASGPSGIPMSDAEALAKLTPKILSTKRFDLSTIFNAVGSSIKTTAIKATGCFAMVLSTPVVLFGLIAGQWKAALITIAIVCAGLIIVFKVIEYRFKKKFSGGPMGGLAERDKKHGRRATVAGPLNEKERSERLDQILAAAGFPTLAVIANDVDSDDSLEGML